MKKVLKSVAIILLCLLLVIAFSACGDEDGKTSSKKKSGTSSTTQNEEKKKESILDNDDIYYFIYKGVKIQAGDLVSNLSYTQLTPDKKDYQTDSCDVISSYNDVIFTVKYKAESTDDEYLNAEIVGVSVSDYYLAMDEGLDEFEIYGGIKMGSTKEEVEKVFGEPESNSYETTYYYEGSEYGRTVTIRFDKDSGTVDGIEWENRSAKINKNRKPEISRNAAVNKTRKEVDKTPVDYKDDSIYYVVVDGTKVNVGDKMTKIEELGLHIQSAAKEKELPEYGIILGNGVEVYNKNGNGVFYCTPVNMRNEKKLVKDAEIGRFELTKEKFKYFSKIEITNGITIGTSKEDIKAVFGEPTKVETKTSSDESEAYYYKAEDNKYFLFIFDKEGKAREIAVTKYSIK